MIRGLSRGKRQFQHTFITSILVPSLSQDYQIYVARDDEYCAFRQFVLSSGNFLSSTWHEQQSVCLSQDLPCSIAVSALHTALLESVAFKFPVNGGNTLALRWDKALRKSIDKQRTFDQPQHVSHWSNRGALQLKSSTARFDTRVWIHVQSIALTKRPLTVNTRLLDPAVRSC